MKVCILLVSLWFLCWRTEAQSRTYLITAPIALRLDASETVLLQLFGFTDQVTVHIFLKTSMAQDHKVLAQDVVTLNAQNHHQAIARVRLFPHQLEKSLSQVVLHVQSAEINQHLLLPVTRSNGFLFLQTDKPLYTPRQSVKVRAFSLNQELMPANRSVFLTFKDPDQSTVDMVEMVDVNNGIPSMQNPFKIPIKPKLGIWSIEATYSDDFTTKARTDFEVKEYVLPSLSIVVEPEVNYISYGNFNGFDFKVSARYLHGAPVADAEVFLRYGYISGKSPPVIIPNSVSRQRLSSSGEVEVTVNVEKVFSKYNGPKTLDSLVGKYLYVAVLLEESTGGITQEDEFTAVKFLKSPYTLSLVSTPPFIKPGLPYNIQVLVRDHLEKPVNRVPIRLVARQLVRQGRDNEEMPCPDSSTSQSDGLAIFLCNTPAGSVRTVLMFETADPSLPAASQASLRLQASAYHSPNHRYLYIDTPLPGYSLQPGRFANIKVYSATPSYLPIKAFSYLVLSRGTVVDFGSLRFVRSSDNKHNLNFMVTPSMVPSIRLLVYYILYGEGTAELVADSVWLDVRDKCVSGLQTDMSLPKRSYKPKENIKLTLRTNQDGLVAMSAVDSALFTLRSNYKDPVSMVLRGIERSDQGCGGGGGKDSADVLRLAGLTFITNANTQPHSSSEACTAAVRSKRAPTMEEKNNKSLEYGPAKPCCEQGMRYSPKSRTCLEFATQRFPKNPVCRRAFSECCDWLQKYLSKGQDQGLYLARHDMGADFDLAPSLVRSYFPESWMWEVQPISRGQTVLSRPLPDSLTTWQLRAVGVFNKGVCVADSVQVAVSLPLSVDVPLPYQVVRGEQVKLRGSVYNQEPNTISFCVTLTVGPGICLLQSHLVAGGAGLHSTSCNWAYLPPGGVGEVAFVVMGLHHGEHTLTFTLKTRDGARDILEKTLRVVPEGVRQEVNSGGTLDPQGLYGSERRTVLLKNHLPAYMVPHTPVERLLTIHGEILGEVVNLVLKAEGVQQLVNLPAGSAQAELGSLLPLVLVYQYLETTRSWEILKGGTIQENSAELRRKIREGLVSLSSFRCGDSSYSMWMKRESSTWLTALVVRTMAEADQIMSVDHQTLSDSVNWLIRKNQNPDGSFVDRSSFSPNRVMAEGADAVAQSVYLTSFVLIALKTATSINDPILQLRSHDESMSSAVQYISQHASGLKSVYVRAVATYALTLQDPNSMTASQLFSSLEKLARQKESLGRPVLRYWQESSVAADWLKPDQSSGETVEMTAYVLLTALLKGRIEYVNPILAWLTQDQYSGEGFYSNQDTVLTLKALTEYSRVIPKAVLNQDINIRFGTTGEVHRVSLSQSHPVATPIQVTTNQDISVITGYGRGVSNVKLKTVYYRTTASTQTRCNFELNIEVFGRDTSTRPGLRAPHLVACVKYKPPPNELYTESTLTLMKIQLPTGLEAYLEDLRQFTDLDEPIISHYELQENTLIIQMDSVPSDIFQCVGFRIRTSFQVDGASQSLFTVSEPQDKGSLCSKQFSYQEQKLQRLCVAEQCQCMTGVCASYRGTVDGTLTPDRRTNETCRPEVRYAYKVNVVSTAAEGDFMTYKATVVEVLKNTDGALVAVRSGTEVELVKKTTCSEVELQKDKTYLLLGARGSEVIDGHQTRYRFPLDSDALVELLPTDCSSPECLDYISQLEDFTLDLQLSGCP